MSESMTMHTVQTHTHTSLLILTVRKDRFTLHRHLGDNPPTNLITNNGSIQNQRHCSITGNEGQIRIMKTWRGEERGWWKREKETIDLWRRIRGVEGIKNPDFYSMALFTNQGQMTVQPLCTLAPTEGREETKSDENTWTDRGPWHKQ